MKIVKIESGTTTRHDTYESGYYIEIKQYPNLRRYVWAYMYHWYDMRIPSKVPGWHRFQKWLQKHGASYRAAVSDEKPRFRDRLLGWSVEQDVRCWYLHNVDTLYFNNDLSAYTYWGLQNKIKYDWQRKRYDEDFPDGDGPPIKRKKSLGV